MTQHISTNPILSRRNFLKLAAGAAAGAALFPFASGRTVQAAEGYTPVLRPENIHSLPAPVQAAHSSDMVRLAHRQLLGAVDSIKNRELRQNTRKLIEDPVPTVAGEYTSKSAVTRLYAALAGQGLIDTAKISEAQLLPPFSGTAPQPFLSAPGSGYGSHHAYPGGLATHVEVNVRLTDAICSTYKDIFYYQVDRDTAIAAQALHDIAKPWVFQWQEDGSSLPEYTIAATGAHHILSLAEVLYRGFPAEEVVAQACAHTPPTSAGEEEIVAGYLRAAAIIAGKDAVRYGLVSADGKRIPAPHKQEGYIVHLGDHDWILSVPAAQKAVQILKDIAASEYGMSAREQNGAAFNHFRNYIAAQASLMRINFLAAQPNGLEEIKSLVQKIITA